MRRLKMRTPAIFQVRIIVDPARSPEKKTHVVLPGDLYVMGEDSVIFSTKNTAAQIWFPQIGEFFEGNPSPQLRIEAGSQAGPFVVKKKLPVGQIFAYAVFCENQGKFAEGNSSPTMIIEG